MEVVSYLLNCFLQHVIMVFWFHQLGKPKKSAMFTVIVGFSALCCVILLLFAVGETNIGETLAVSLRVAASFLTFVCLYRDHLLKKILLYAAFSIFAVPSQDLVVYGIMEKLFHVKAAELYEVSSYLSAGMLMTEDLLMIFVVLICMLLQLWRFKQKRQIRDLVIMDAFITAHFVFLLAYYMLNWDSLTESNNLIQLAFQVLLFVMVFIQYFNSQRTRELMQSEQALRTLQSRMETDYSYYKLADSKFTEISALRHDIQNQIQTVKTLLHSKDGVSQAENIIDRLQSHLDAVRAVNYCENRTINAVLTVKLGEKQMQGIRTEIVLRDCDALPFDDYDLCSLVSNLFDNAVNACLSCPEDQERFIELKSGIREGYFLLRCTNSCQNTEKQSPRREGQGYGTEIMERICQKYGGSFSLRFEDKTACATASLRLENV